MNYDVEITPEAEKDFDRFVDYLVNVKRNRQAAGHLIDDFEDTIDTLSIVAGNLKLCSDMRLRKLGYRRMNFLSMRYFMLYRVEGNTVIVDAIFHEMQDYENQMR